MNIPKEQLEELREYFRIKFREEDFCIGEGQVERVFRELLGEPEPVREVIERDPKDIQRTQDIIAVELERITPKLTEIFDHDSAFFDYLKKRR